MSRLETNDVPEFGWLDMLKAFSYLLGKRKAKYLFFLSIVLISYFYAPVIAVYVIGKIVDFFSKYKPGDSLYLFYAYAIFLGVCTAGVSFIRLSIKNLLYKIQSEVVYFTRVRGFERLLDFSIKWHDKENTGNKVQKIQNGTEAFGNFQRLLANDIFTSIASIFGVLIAFLFLRPVYLLFSLVYLSAYLTIQASYYKRMLSMQNEFNTLQEKASGTYYEGLGNVLTIKTLGANEDFKKNIIGREELTRDYSKKIAQFGTDKWKFFQAVNGIGITLFLLLIGKNFVDKDISLGSIFVFINYFITLTLGIGQATNLVDQVVNLRISLGRMMPIYWDKILVRSGNKDFPSTWDKIIITQGTFSYKESGENAAIKGIDMLINRFEKIGIVGKSGSGKSTLAKLFLDLYEFNKGEFSIGDVNYYDLRQEEITDNISLVLQDSEMFNLSLRDNITLMKKMDDNLFELAITISQLQGLIKKLPNGLDTLIGEKGYRLSGGERQRIGIARAIYKNPQILVMDEATSSLDSKTESLIQEAMEEKLSKKTMIIIAHRVSTLKNVDKIYVLENGKIVEEGKFNELISEKKSKFYDLSQLQKTQFAI
jgi:ABC-type multidrug transport system fused ATPase/permease subunit